MSAEIVSLERGSLALLRMRTEVSTPAASPSSTKPECDSLYPLLAHPRYPSLDLWRGLACLMIIVLHASFSYKASDSAAERSAHPLAWAILSRFEWMSVGVPLFFVISGYCVAATSDSSRRRSRGTADFFVRRVRRILPPYWIALALTLALYVGASGLFPGVVAPLGGWHDGAVPLWRAFSPAQWWGNFSITEQWRAPLFGHGPALLLPPTWTLCYEEQFYALCGLLLLMMPGRFFLGTLAVSLLTAGLYAAAVVNPHVRLDGFFFDGRWLMFAAGVLVYHSLNYQKIKTRWFSAAVLLFGVSMATLIYKWPNLLSADSNIRDIAYSIRISGLYALLLMALRPLDLKIAAARILSPLKVCGRMCYSLYLIHWPVAKLIESGLYHAGPRGFVPTLTITVPLVTAASLLAGWLFHLCVERHFVNPRRTVNAC